jgi:hypothetical protein
VTFVDRIRDRGPEEKYEKATMPCDEKLAEHIRKIPTPSSSAQS